MAKGKKGKSIFTGTFLGEIQEFFATKQFDIPELDPVEDGEEVVGELNDTEKAVFALIHAKLARAKAMIPELKKAPPDDRKAKIIEAQKLRDQIELCKKLGWQLIEDRLGSHNSNLILRAGDKIAKKPEQATVGSMVGVSLLDLLGLGR